MPPRCGSQLSGLTATSDCLSGRGYAANIYRTAASVVAAAGRKAAQRLERPLTSLSIQQQAVLAFSDFVADSLLQHRNGGGSSQSYRRSPMNGVITPTG